MARVTEFVVCAVVILAAGTAFASTGGDRLTGMRLLPDAQLRLSMLGDLLPAGVGQSAVPGEDTKKSYAVAIPMAFLLGFGSGHFYVGATWRGLRYLAYDLVAIGLDVAILLLARNYDYDMTYTWVVMGIVFGGNRIFQTIDAAQTVNAHNKGMDVSESNRMLVPPAQQAVSLNDGGMAPARMKTVYTF